MPIAPGTAQPRHQTAAVVPTPEAVALTLPDSLNPRYSYGGSKIVSELIVGATRPSPPRNTV